MTKYVMDLAGRALTSSLPRAFAMIGMIISFVMLAILTMIGVNQMMGPDASLPSLTLPTTSIPGGVSGTTPPPTSAISGAQGSVNSTAALAIANKVFYSDQAGYPALSTTAAQYALGATGTSGVASVVAVTGGAQFNFSSGASVCITVGAAGVSPALTACA